MENKQLNKNLAAFKILLIAIICITPTTYAHANYRKCVNTEKSKWEKERTKNPVIIIEDAIVNNPSNTGTGFPTVTIPIPNFKKICAERAAKRYSFYHRKNWKWFLKEKGEKRQTIDTQILTTRDSIRLDVKSFDANKYGRSANIRLYYTNAFGVNVNIDKTTSSYSGVLPPTIYRRTKIGRFITDTIVFYRGKAECPVGRVCPE